MTHCGNREKHDFSLKNANGYRKSFFAVVKLQLFIKSLCANPNNCNNNGICYIIIQEIIDVDDEFMSCYTWKIFCYAHR